MAFVQVDPSQIKFDVPSMGQAPSGFVPVDPTKIQFDSPKLNASQPNIIEQIGASPLGSAVGNVIDQTGSVLKNIPNQNPASSGLQIMGQGAKMAATLPAQAIAAASQPIVAPAQSISNAIDSTGIGQTIGDKFMAAKDFYNNFSQAHPEISSDINAGLNVATTLGGGKASAPLADEAQSVLSTANNGVKGLADQYAAKYPVGTAPLDPLQMKVNYPVSSDALETAASLHYDDAAKMGGVIKPSGFQDTLNAIKQKVGYQTPEGIAFAGDNPVTDTINNLDKMQEMPISLKGLDEMDGTLRSKISVAMRAGDNETASKLLDIKSMLKNASTTVKPEDLVNPEAFDSWRKGDVLWSAKSKMKQLQGIVDNAYNTDNPDSAMRSGYRTLSKQLAKNSKGWTQPEIDLVKQGGQQGLTAGALKIVGSKLMSGLVGAAAGSFGGPFGTVGGALAGEAIGYPMRVAGNALQESRAMAPLKAVSSRPSVVAAIPQSVSEITKLPMAQQKAALEALFNARKFKVSP